MSRSIENISEELGRKNLEHEKIHYKRKELNLNSGKNNDQYYVRRVATNCVYFVKKGGCRYGSLCRFIHPEKKMDFGTEHSSLDLQRQIPLLGSSKEEASSQVVHGEDRQKEGRPICQVSGEGQQKAGSPLCRVSREDQQKAGSPICRYCVSPVGCMCGNTCHFAHHQNKVDVGLNKSSSADFQVLLKVGIPIHVPYLIPFPAKFTIPVGPTGLPLRAGRPVCKYYSHFGLCKYGIGCQDDHPQDLRSVAVSFPQRSVKRRDPHK